MANFSMVDSEVFYAVLDADFFIQTFYNSTIKMPKAQNDTSHRFQDVSFSNIWLMKNNDVSGL